MYQSKKNKIIISNNEIYYEIIGEGIPLLMIHGWGVDHRLMSGCMEPIFEKNEYPIQRIYFDLPGMGQSKADYAIQNSDDVLNLILTFIDEVIPNQPFLLAGESYGGYLARALVQKRSEQLLGLLLICPLVIPGYREGNVPPMTVLEKDNEFLESLNEKQRSSFESITIVQTKEVWESFEKDIYVALALSDHNFLNHHLDGAFTYDINILDKPFEKPSLFIMGRQDTEVGWKDQFQLMENYPRASFVVLDKAGHNIQIEQFELFKHLVNEWITRSLPDIYQSLKEL